MLSAFQSDSSAICSSLPRNKKQKHSKRALLLNHIHSSTFFFVRRLERLNYQFLMIFCFSDSAEISQGRLLVTKG